MLPYPPRRRWLDLAALLDPTGRDPAGVHMDRGMIAADRDWLALYQLATAHLVAPVLYATLATRDRLSQVPPDVRTALEGLYQLNDQRNRRLRAVLRDTVRLLNQAGIEPILLKGAIALLPEQYPLAFARVLGDLDLAVADTQLRTAVAALQAAGYYPAPKIDRRLWPNEYYHWLPLFHPSGDGYVELHHDLFNDRRLKAALSLPMVQARAQARDWDGHQVRIPTLEHRLLHNALHHQVDDQAFESDQRSLRQLLEFAQLRAWPAGAEPDWPGLLRPLDRVGVGAAVRAWLLAAQTLFGQPLPAGVEPGPAARRAEARFWTRLEHPGRGRLLELRWQVRCFARLLRNLPRHLVTPAWYPTTCYYLRQQWFPPRPSDALRRAPPEWPGPPD